MVPMSSSHIKQWLYRGELEKLEHLVLEGRGARLLGENSPDLRTRVFLKGLPNYLTKIAYIHDAVKRGSLSEIQRLISEEPKKKLAVAKDPTGTPLLHKAVYYDHQNIAQWIVNNYPSTAEQRDREGRSALHYCAASRDPESVWDFLVEAGCDSSVCDKRGNPAAYYLQRGSEIDLPDSEKMMSRRQNNVKDSKLLNAGLDIKPSNIRIWIHNQDIRKLQQVLWEGHGSKLRCETSNHPRVKKFLEAVPFIMGTIRDIHHCAVKNDVDLFRKIIDEPIPPIVLSSKDANGLNALHKAAGLGHVEFAREILEKYLPTVHAQDNEGRTPLHCAAICKDGNVMYDMLVEYGAEEGKLDNKHRMAAYYKNKPTDIDVSALVVVPDAPRVSGSYPRHWDWRIIDTDESLFKGSKQIHHSTDLDSAFGSAESTKLAGDSSPEMSSVKPVKDASSGEIDSQVTGNYQLDKKSAYNSQIGLEEPDISEDGMTSDIKNDEIVDSHDHQVGIIISQKSMDNSNKITSTNPEKFTTSDMTDNECYQLDLDTVDISAHESKQSQEMYGDSDSNVDKMEEKLDSIEDTKSISSSATSRSAGFGKTRIHPEIIDVDEEMIWETKSELLKENIIKDVNQLHSTNLKNSSSKSDRNNNKRVVSMEESDDHNSVKGDLSDKIPSEYEQVNSNKSRAYSSQKHSIEENHTEFAEGNNMDFSKIGISDSETKEELLVNDGYSSEDTLTKEISYSHRRISIVGSYKETEMLKFDKKIKNSPQINKSDTDSRKSSEMKKHTSIEKSEEKNTEKKSHQRSSREDLEDNISDCLLENNVLGKSDPHFSSTETIKRKKDKNIEKDNSNGFENTESKSLSANSRKSYSANEKSQSKVITSDEDANYKKNIAHGVKQKTSSRSSANSSVHSSAHSSAHSSKNQSAGYISQRRETEKSGGSKKYINKKDNSEVSSIADTIIRSSKESVMNDNMNHSRPNSSKNYSSVLSQVESTKTVDLHTDPIIKDRLDIENKKSGHVLIINNSIQKSNDSSLRTLSIEKKSSESSSLLEDEKPKLIEQIKEDSFYKDNFQESNVNCKNQKTQSFGINGEHEELSIIKDELHPKDISQQIKSEVVESLNNIEKDEETGMNVIPLQSKYEFEDANLQKENNESEEISKVLNRVEDNIDFKISGTEAAIINEMNIHPDNNKFMNPLVNEEIKEKTELVVEENEIKILKSSCLSPKINSEINSNSKDFETENIQPEISSDKLIPNILYSQNENMFENSSIKGTDSFQSLLAQESSNKNFPGELNTDVKSGYGDVTKLTIEGYQKKDGETSLEEEESLRERTNVVNTKGSSMKQANSVAEYNVVSLQDTQNLDVSSEEIKREPSNSSFSENNDFQSESVDISLQEMESNSDKRSEVSNIEYNKENEEEAGVYTNNKTNNNVTDYSEINKDREEVLFENIEDNQAHTNETADVPHSPISPLKSDYPDSPQEYEESLPAAPRTASLSPVGNEREEDNVDPEDEQPTENSDVKITPRSEEVAIDPIGDAVYADEEAERLAEYGNMEQLAALVLTGEGQRLVGRHSSNPELQAFIDNVPAYMVKIRAVHQAAKEGNLKDLQVALDRRKFAIAKDHSSPHGATPLHVAVIFGHTPIVRYLGGRFPETLHALDLDGRTPLHYAATLADNGHYYNLLLQLGANPLVQDNFGQKADHFKKNQEDLSHKKLLRDFGESESLADEMLVDKGTALSTS